MTADWVSPSGRVRLVLTAGDNPTAAREELTVIAATALAETSPLATTTDNRLYVVDTLIAASQSPLVLMFHAGEPFPNGEQFTAVSVRSPVQYDKAEVVAALEAIIAKLKGHTA